MDLVAYLAPDEPRGAYQAGGVAALAEARGWETLSLRWGDDDPLLLDPEARVVVVGVHPGRGWFRFDWLNGKGEGGFYRDLAGKIEPALDLREGKGPVRLVVPSGPIGVRALRAWLVG